MDELNLEDYGYVMPDYQVGPQVGGTYNVPASAQPNNTPWDSAGGTVGQYGGDVLGILSKGIGAWSQYQNNQQLLDYKRYEATAGGVFAQGRPNQIQTATVTARASSPMLMILLVAGAVLLLRK